MTASPKRSSQRGIFIWLLAIFSLMAISGALLLGFMFIVITPGLPDLDTITDYRPKIPLRVFTSDNVLIGEFGQEHRDFVPIKEMPLVMKNAVLASEDAGFYEHGAMSFRGVMRAIWVDVTHAKYSQGAATITMQVAREFFLSREKKFLRKLYEVSLAYKIEQALSKDQILELYMNQIYLGQRSYGFGTAARTYFGKSVKDLTLAEAAVLAGLPQSPEKYNPVANPDRAKQSQMLILKRMLDLQRITPAQYEQASNEVYHVRDNEEKFNTHAEYVAEMVRQTVYEKFKEDTYTRGIKVITTINQRDQDAAYDAVRRNAIAYDQRHGYRGPEGLIELPHDAEEREQAIDEALSKHPNVGTLMSAVVVSASPSTVRATLQSGEVISISGAGLRFAAAALSSNAKPALKLKPGALIRVMHGQDAQHRWAITQVPQVASAFVAIDAQTGAYRALVGGFAFGASQFNHVTQAWRQPGSSMKPFIYSAAIEKGFSPATLINDAPLVLDAGGSSWEPVNDDGIFRGPITMRNALAISNNVASVRLLRAITANYAHDYIGHFGFPADKHPVNLTLALGTGSVTPQQMVGAYAVFANGGFQVTPYLIQKIVDARGNLISETKPPQVAQESARVIDARNAFIMDSMLREVVRAGTGSAASKALQRTDIAGKTGTTSDVMDGWFAGYGGNTVAVAWMGYDDPQSLGNREFGRTLALPIWIDFMRTALAGKTEVQRAVPTGMSFQNNDWMYDEFVTSGGVSALGFEGGDAPVTNAPTPVTEAQKSEAEKQRILDGFRNGK